MNNLERKNHWENIYQTKDLTQVSWYQPKPEISLDFLQEFKVDKTAKIIDIGGGDSLLVDNLIELGYQDISVLDISALALEKAKKRLEAKAEKVKWIVADIATFQPEEQYDFWHDRAVFHFLTEEHEISNYVASLQKGIKPAGVLILCTFSEDGPKKCSGIKIKQYSEVSMTNKLKSVFEKIKCINVNHKTPFETIQNFVFCSFKKLSIA